MSEFRFTVNGHRIFVTAASIEEAKRKVLDFFPDITLADIGEGPLPDGDTPPGSRPGDLILGADSGAEQPAGGDGGDDQGDSGIQELFDSGVTDASPVGDIQLPADTGVGANPLLAPSTQFRQFLRGQGVNPDSFGGRRLGRFQDDARSVFDIGSATGLFGAPANPDINNPFQQQLGTGLLGKLPSNALTAFRQLLSGDTPQSEQVDLFRNASPGDIGAEELRALAQQALGGVTSKGFSNRFGGQIVNNAARNFQEQADLSPSNPELFSQFLNRRLRLGVG